MALFNYMCLCGNIKRIFLKNAVSIPCDKCKGVMQRNPKGPSTQVMEKLDNGFMIKTLERYADAERIFQERHDNADELAGTKANRS
jgi:hypothetical protein